MRDLQLKFLVNKGNVRWLQILNTLERNHFCSAATLAKATESTTRTIRKDINSIREYFKNEVNISTTRMGYHFDVIDLPMLLEKKKLLVVDEVLLSIVNSVFNQELLFIDDWAEKFYLSKSTLVRYLQKIRVVLVRYDLILSYNPLDFIGKETNIRKFFHDFYYESDITPHTIFPPYILQEKTEILFLNEDIKVGLSSSPADFQYSLYIAIERSFKGSSINLSEKLVDFFDKDKEFIKFCAFKSLIKEMYGYWIAKEELTYLYLMLLGKQSIERLENNFNESYNKWPEIEEITKRYIETFFQMSDDKRRDTSLIRSFLVSKKLNALFSPILNQNLEDINRYIKEVYDVEYERNTEFFEKYTCDEFISQEYLIDFYSSFTLYTESIKEMYWEMKRNIGIIVEGNQYIRDSIKARTIKYFSGNHNLFFPTVREFNLEYLERKKIDLIVTNYNEHLLIDNLKTDSILFKAIPDMSDWNHLSKKINTYTPSDF